MSVRFSIACLFGLAVVGAMALADSSSDVDADPNHIANVTSKPITGYLGGKLGSKLVIEGIATDGGMFTYPMTVEKVNEQPLKIPNPFEIRGAKLVKGTHYKLEGYESGEFAGTPAWVAPNAQQPFMFHSFFVVTKVIEPQSP